MDKKELLSSVLGKIQERNRESEKRLTEILRRANEAPGAMESHSDTDKNQWGRQAAGQKEAIETAKREYESTKLLSLSESPGTVEIGSLVLARDETGSHRYFILPGGGGIKIDDKEGEVVVLTPRTPLGSALLGKEAGEIVCIAHRTLTVLEIY